MTAANPVLGGLDVLVRDCVSSGVPRRALLLRMDLLPRSLSRPHHLRLARAALDPLTGADRAHSRGRCQPCQKLTIRSRKHTAKPRLMAAARGILQCRASTVAAAPASAATA